MKNVTLLLPFLILVSLVPSAHGAIGGTVVAWGYNASGQTDVPAGLNGVVAVSAGWQHSVALKADGTVVAWGTNEFGQLNIPPGLNGVAAIASGHSHILALRSNGTVVAWGRNLEGNSNVPADLTGVKAVAAGGHISMALKTNGTVVAWGGTVNAPTNVAVMAAGSIFSSPVFATNGSGVAALAVGGTRVVTLRNDGTIFDSFQTAPAGLNGVTAVSVGISDDHVLVLKNDGTVVTWGGSALFPEVGNVPSGLRGVTAIAAGGLHSLAVVTEIPFTFGSLNLYAGTTLTGPIGQQFRVDYADVLTAGVTNWFVLTNITLPSSPYLVIDPSSAGQTKRFYRAVPLP